MADVAIPQRPREAQSGSSSHIRAAELEALLNRFKAEHGRCVVLHGPRGAGKRDLAAALKREVQREPGAVVLEGHTLGAGSGSFQPFSEIARQAMGWAAQSDATEALIDPNLDALALVLEHPEGLAATPQDHDRATYARLLRKEDGHLDLSRPAAELERQIRAYTPWPGASLPLASGRLKVIEACTADVEPGKAGTIAALTPEFVLRTGSGGLQLIRVQPPGKKPMSAQDFLRGAGRSLEVGQTLQN